eukprot:TRINITY_DN3694_c0_g1_i1.p1 TRINITY_DN3694_c0_g1~~TRINITY_DN3694_c0_g1_i1.p1  ORF type:complete len:290 (+),score=35.28 TRINITY_DN3694_c0_g1_i1:73-942(+)
MSRIRAVFFDLGGVVFDSPFQAISQYEAKVGLPENFVNRLIVQMAHDSAWSKLETGEYSLDQFYSAFNGQAKAFKNDLPAQFSAEELMSRISEHLQPNFAMISFILRLKHQYQLKIGAITNNWFGPDGKSNTETISFLFDVIIESCKERIKKPNPEIYRIAVKKMESHMDTTLHFNDCIFLDDIGRNLKSARKVGFHTVRVFPDKIMEAINQAEAILGIPSESNNNGPIREKLAQQVLPNHLVAFVVLANDGEAMRGRAVIQQFQQKVNLKEISFVLTMNRTAYTHANL